MGNSVLWWGKNGITTHTEKVCIEWVWNTRLVNMWSWHRNRSFYIALWGYIYCPNIYMYHSRAIKNEPGGIYPPFSYKLKPQMVKD